MEENSDFLSKLEVSIQQRKEMIELNELPKLKEYLGIFQTYYENIYNILIRKSLIQEDPYKYDEKISEVTVPSAESFMDSEKQEQLSQRLASYHTQLEFLNNYYQFSLDFLNLKRVKSITGLIKYINWLSLTPAATQLMTRSLAELIAKIKLGSDNLSSQIIVDSVAQNERIVKLIIAQLDGIISFLREVYKLKIRKSVFSHAQLNPKDSIADSIKMIKKIFPVHINDEAFYPELIEEILKEENPDHTHQLKQDLIAKLAIKEQKVEKVDKKKSFKAILLQGVRILASSGFQIEDAVSKLNENNGIYKTRKMSVGERFSKWLRKVVNGKEDTQTYEIQFVDIVTSSTKVEKIIFLDFIDEMQKKGKLFTALTNKASSTYCRLEAASDTKIFEFLNQTINQLQLILRRMTGLNEFFKTETPKDRRGKIRAINIEINAVKNSIIKSNKKKHEYVALKEEQEQMKRLGIKAEG